MKKNIRDLHQSAYPSFRLLGRDLPPVQFRIVIEFFDHRSPPFVGPGSDFLHAIGFLRMIFFICHTDGDTVKRGGNIVPINTDAGSEHAVVLTLSMFNAIYHTM